MDPYERFLHDNPQDAARVRRLIDEGRRHLEQGEPDAARASFMRALAIFPLIPAALTNLAALALHQNRHKEAWLYLERVLEHFPDDPAAHGVAIRYWLARGSRPMAYRHGERAVAGLRRLLSREEELDDRTVIDRARVILVSALRAFAADRLLVDLYAVCGERPWDDAARLTFGIAHYNLGAFEAARSIWRSAGSEARGDLYLMLLDLVDAGVIPPFALDYELGARLPSLEELQEALQIPLPGRKALRPVPEGEEAAPGGPSGTLPRFAVVRPLASGAALEALQRIVYRGGEEAEVAFAVLFFAHWPFLPELLSSLLEMPRLPVRTRLNAVLYLLWTHGVEAAEAALRQLDEEPMDAVERLIYHVVGIQLALAAENLDLGRSREMAARRAAAEVPAGTESWLAVLNELSLHLDRLERQRSSDTPADGPDAPAAKEQPADGAAHGNIIPFPAGRGLKRPRDRKE